MISDGLILSLIACAALVLMSVRRRSMAASFVASVGLIICSLFTFQETDSLLAMGLLIMVSIAQFMLIGVGEK